jgi:hypothetical protein
MGVMPEAAPWPDDPLERVGWSLGRYWPHYWEMRGLTRAQLCEQRPPTETRVTTSRAADLGVLGLQLTVVARRALAGVGPSAPAIGAAAALLGLADGYYLCMGIAALKSELVFDWYQASAPTRPESEALMRGAGIADWCAAAGHPLKDASGMEIRLDADDVPAPTLATPQLFGVLARMQPRVTAAPPNTDAYRRVAMSLSIALDRYRQHVRPAIVHGTTIPDADRSRLTTEAENGLFWSLVASSEVARATGANEDSSLDMDVVTTLRFLAQDLLMVAYHRPDRYPSLPVTPAEEYEAMVAPDSGLHWWIEAHSSADAAS